MGNVQINISQALHSRLTSTAKDRGVELNELVEQLLSDGLSDGAVYEQPDEEKIKERLKSLGYID